MSKKNQLIYLDHSATTPVDKAVLKAMLPYFIENYGNASSTHSFGQAAANAVNRARENVANFLNCDTSEIVFTSGATESDNLAIFGVVNSLRKNNSGKFHIITSAIEHPAVLEPFKRLAGQGVEVTYLPVGKSGLVDLEIFKKSIKDNTVLVSIMYVNSEIGIIEPIREIGEVIEKINAERAGQGGKKRIYFHSDAVQALNFLDCDTKSLQLDLLSFSGHKIYGPKGIGVLFVKSGTPIQGLQLGGHHERDLRSGTLNVPSIVGLAEAVKICSRDREKNNKKILKLRNNFVAAVKKRIKNAVVNTDLKNSTPSLASISFVGAEGESILIALDLSGVAVSTGSACASASLEASPVLLAIGIKEETCHSTIRFSFGKNNTDAEVKKVLKILPPIIEKLSKMAP